MIIKKITYIILITTILLSCKKYGHGRINGKVIESDTGAPISNAKVTIGKWKKRSSSDSYKYEIFDSTFTDNNGDYSFPIDKERKYRYSLNCSHPNYYRSLDNFEVNYKNDKHDFSLDPLGFVQLRIKKTTQSFAEFIGTINYQPFDLFYKELPFDTILPKIYKAKGNATNYIDWRSGSLQMPRQEVFVGRGDTILLTFELN